MRKIIWTITRLRGKKKKRTDVELFNNLGNVDACFLGEMSRDLSRERIIDHFFAKVVCWIAPDTAFKALQTLSFISLTQIDLEAMFARSIRGFMARKVHESSFSGAKDTTPIKFQ